MPSFSPSPSAPGPRSGPPPEERYEIVGRIASGGMAEIYLARSPDERGRRQEVVLKRLMPELQGDQEFVQMFYDEANIASRLRHPGIVHIFELGELDGSLFIAMELLHGINLRDLLARLHGRGQSLPIPHALRIASECLEALHYAHEFADEKGRRLNVVHRDVSPQNIIVTYDGRVKLVDFGVAKAEGRLHQTRAGLVKGKFAYMSPEQITGGTVDGRSDLFALTEVFYELLLRHHPFYAATDMDVLRAILDSEPPHPTSIDPNFPSELAAIFMKALRNKPGDRFPSAGKMQDALERFMEDRRQSITTVELSRFVSDLFSDRLDIERRARETGDDDLLLEAMTAGAAEKGSLSGINPVAQTSSDIVPTPLTEERAPVPQAYDPANGPANYLGDEQTTGRRRIRSEIQSLFGSDEESAPEQPVSSRPLADHLPEEDAAEMPTVLGAFTPEQLAEVRAAADAARSQPPMGRRPQGAAVVIRDEAVRVDPAEQRLGVDPSVTTRSETVVAQDEASSTPVPRKHDRLGILSFLVGLGGLIGALIYAGMQLLGQSGPASVDLVINSNPPGATIILDGNDIGAKTPRTIPSLPSDRSHLIELYLEGHLPYSERLAPAASMRHHEINAELPKLSSPTP